MTPRAVKRAWGWHNMDNTPKGEWVLLWWPAHYQRPILGIQDEHGWRTGAGTRDTDHPPEAWQHTPPPPVYVT